MALSLLFIPIWPRLAIFRATSRARCVQLAFWLFGPLLLALTACTPGYKIRSNNAELFQKDLSFIFHKDWLQKHCRLSVKSMTPMLQSLSMFYC